MKLHKELVLPAMLLAATTALLATTPAQAGQDSRSTNSAAAPAPVEDLSQPATQPASALPPVIPVDFNPATGASTTPAAATKGAVAAPTALPANPASPAGSGQTTAGGNPSAAPEIDAGIQADMDAALPPLGQPVALTSPAMMAVNSAHLAHAAVGGKFSTAALRAQILLDRAHFSPGEIDGAYGSNMAVALAGYQHDYGLPVTGKLDKATWQSLTRHDPAPALSGYRLAIQDISGPFIKTIPGKIINQAELPCACYTSPWEELGEKFHIRPTLLQRYNRGRTIAPGAVLIVPMIHREPPAGRAARIIVTAHLKAVVVLDAGSHILAQYPATIGSTHDPLPVGQWKILGVAHHPRYHYDPVHFWDANKSDPKATVQAGPNNPVGIVWTQLSIPHYGVHGTPEPSRIGKTFSHGCIRLTNWDAMEFSRLVRPGTPAILEL